MSDPEKPGLFSELKRRKVLKVGATYVVAAWVVIEVASVLLPTFEAPAWAMKALTVVVILGCFLAIVMAWVFDFSPGGLSLDPGPPSRKEPDPLLLTESGSASAAAQGGSQLARLAVLPLTAMSSSPEDEYLADGLTEDLITLLSRTPGLFVIARNSTFVYKGKAVSINQVARDLKVRYVIEGSVRKFGDSIRINIQLIDGETEHHVWAERYDCEESRIFSMQDDISQKISAQLSTPLLEAETDRVLRLPPEDIDAWLLTQRALRTFYFAGPEKESAIAAFKLLAQALEKEPEYPYALGFDGHLRGMSLIFGFSENPQRDAELAFSESKKALALAPKDPMILSWYGVVEGFLGSIEAGIAMLQTSIKLNPNNSHARANLGYLLGRMGRVDEGYEHVRMAFELSPNEPRAYIWHFFLGSLKQGTDQEAALASFEDSLANFSKYLPAVLARIAMLEMLGRKEEAQKAAAEFRQSFPDMTFAQIRQFVERGGPLKNVQLREDILAAIGRSGLEHV
jgi:adenylate cyclase